MRNSRSFLNRHVGILALLCLISTAPSLFAQNAPGSLHFLEEFAIHLYERGETAQAKKEFERILTIDPTNAVAQQYLKNASPAPQAMAPATSSTMQQLNTLSVDITRIKQEILHYQDDAAVMTTTIRQLITENDALYTILKKRSRQIADMQSRFEGSSYEDQYNDLLSTLIPDRVPQHPFSTDDLASSAPRRSNEQAAIERLTQEIATAETEIKHLRTVSPEERKKIGDLELALQGKRALLLEKTASLIQNKEDLTKLQTELTQINASLKNTDGRYSAVIKDLDSLQLALKSSAGTIPPADNAPFKDLLNDYNDRIREISSLKVEIASRDATLMSLKQSMQSREKNMTVIDAGITTKDREIAEYKDLLISYKKRLAEKDAAIAQQAAELTEKKAAIARQTVALERQDAELARQANEIKEKTAEMIRQSSQVERTTTAIEKQNTELARQAAEINKKRADIARQAAKLEEQQATITQQTGEITKKDQDLARQKADLSLTDAQLKVVDTQVVSIETLLEESDQDMAALQAGFTRVRGLIQDQQRIKAAPAPSPISLSAEDIAALQQKLISEENKASDLQQKITLLTKTLSDKDQEIRTARDMMESAQRELTQRETDLIEKDDTLIDLHQNLVTLEKRLIETATENETLKKQPSPSAPVKHEKPACARCPLTKAPQPSQETVSLHEILSKKDKDIVDLNKKVIEQNVENRKLTALLEADRVQTADKGTLLKEIALLNASLETSRKDKEALTTSRCALQNSELDIRERDSAITSLQNTLDQKTAALEEADGQIALLEEKLAAINIKQSAIKDVIQKRDEELQKAQALLQASEAARQTKSDARTRVQDLELTLGRAGVTVKEKDEEISRLKTEILQLREDLAYAHSVATKKDIEKGRLSEELGQQKPQTP